MHDWWAGQYPVGTMGMAERSRESKHMERSDTVAASLEVMFRGQRESVRGILQDYVSFVRLFELRMHVGAEDGGVDAVCHKTPSKDTMSKQEQIELFPT